jgi:GntR family transcriptional regulator
MLLHIDPHSGVPIYRQLQDQIRMAIVSGVWREGDEVPTTRALSEQLGVNPMTISKVYSILEREGWFEYRRGKPLLVRRREEADGNAGDLRDLLRNLLRPVAQQVKQLGIPEEIALKEWEQLLRDETAKPSSDDEP